MQSPPLISAELHTELSRSLNVTSLHFRPVRGGSINACFEISSAKGSTFCKINNATKFPHLFDREKKGLEILSNRSCFRIPDVLDCFEVKDQQVLLMEWIEQETPREVFWRRFGEQLARLHSQHHSTFGLDHDNYMGAVPQANTPCADWVAFFSTYRLQPLADQCFSRGLLSEAHQVQLEVLYKRLPALFEEEDPSLLHGDLWSGNFLCGAGQEPVLIDPAVYYGHRSMDLGMTALFGGFEKPFYDAYHYHFPFPLNYKEQWEVCQLYPLLIHLLLFGKSYLPAIESTLREFQ